MILVDTSVWVDYLRGHERRLADILTEGLVLTHPLVIEELACGNLLHRAKILDLLRALPIASLASHEEVLELICAERLHGTGLGAVDAHLLASARLSRARIWSKDRALCRAAGHLALLGHAPENEGSA
ncbi:MAG TPA: VapC toxin family PIN domain ribonuclease [Elusimicrobia bacterium]|nr:VapC toxin family PIN domain ribonuclease [Elusimicrobiota bacterium]